MAPILGIIASSITGGLVTDNGAMFPIRSYVVPSGGTTTVTFDLTGITGYTHLQLRTSAKAGGTAGATTLCLRFNSDSGNNYNSHYLLGDGTVTEAGAYTAANATTQSCLIGTISGSSVTPFGVSIIDILDYNNSNKYKTARSLIGTELNTTDRTSVVQLKSALWRNTNAITSITVINYEGNGFAQYSSFALYGVKA
jgi:hypothetical protein